MPQHFHHLTYFATFLGTRMNDSRRLFLCPYMKCLTVI
uniref:Uncharacterized protein n=1 Tax=Anguilla anguilla TaxID=7936 RepID=A0A0E9U5R9_ANGAN